MLRSERPHGSLSVDDVACNVDTLKQTQRA
jgi:hypothetical protein